MFLDENIRDWTLAGQPAHSPTLLKHSFTPYYSHIPSLRLTPLLPWLALALSCYLLLSSAPSCSSLLPFAFSCSLLLPHAPSSIELAERIVWVSFIQIHSTVRYCFSSCTCSCACALVCIAYTAFPLKYAIQSSIALLPAESTPLSSQSQET